MSEAPPDFSALARRYLDLWQEQVSAVANDPALAEAVARGVAMMTQAPAILAQAATAGVHATEKAASHGPKATDISPHSVPPGPPAAAAAPDDPRDDAAVLARRVAALEKRVAALEAQLGGRGAGAEGKPRRRRT